MENIKQGIPFKVVALVSVMSVFNEWLFHTGDSYMAEWDGVRYFVDNDIGGFNVYRKDTFFKYFRVKE